jgi:hypothetical protein
MTADDPVEQVERHLVDQWGADSGRGDVTFLGTEQMSVLRFGTHEGDVTRYVTVGASRSPMSESASSVIDPVAGPRMELVLSVRGRPDSVLRRLAVLAAAPAVEGLVIRAGAIVELGEPLWEGARFTAVLIGAPGGLIPDLELGAGRDPVQFHPVFPITANEAAYKRVHGTDALEEGWLQAGIDLRDPARPELPAAGGVAPRH